MSGDRPYTTLSCAMSLDGHIDDLAPRRLVLSDDADWDRVDAVRADHDAILVGAGTVRADDPRLLVRSERRRAARVAAGRPPNPLRVTLTSGGGLDPGHRMFADTAAPTLVYTSASAAPALTRHLAAAPAATVVAAGEPLDLRVLLADLRGRGVERLMVEGGGRVHTRFLAESLADELHLVIAPFMVGEGAAPRFLYPAAFPQTPAAPMRLAEAKAQGDLVLLRYLL
ncbi:RibD family protein [Murinocardiopsis flavida]|uniref:RibD family protein n=1 Tax=Murinocardiopsis flavida TaxID=645275 RepID=UPI000D0D6CE0|nr:dihydrofolate reductase family protein [Murinocardiopsis flavida]